MDIVLLTMLLLLSVLIYLNSWKKVPNLKYYLLIMISCSSFYFFHESQIFTLMFYSVLIHLLYESGNLSKSQFPLARYISDFNILIFSVLLVHQFIGILPIQILYFVELLYISIGVTITILVILKCSIYSITLNVLFVILQFGRIFSFYAESLVLLNMFTLIIISFLQSRSIEIDLRNENDHLKVELDFAYNCFKRIEEAIHSEEELSTIFSMILRSLLETVEGESGAIYVIEDDVPLKIVEQGNFVELDNWEGIGYKEFFVKNTESSFYRQFKKYTNRDSQYISSLIIRPISLNGNLKGYLILENKTFQKEFSQSDFDRTSTFVNFASMALGNIEKNRDLLTKKEMEKEINIAAEIQKGLVPNHFPSIKGCNISVLTKPAKGMSGDYYDVIPLSDKKFLLVICDVAGKGVPAAIVTVIIRTIVNLVAKQVKKASTILNWINRGLVGHIEMERYATLCCLIVDGHNQTINFANAGHHPCLLKRKSKIIEICGEGLPVGVTNEAQFQNVNFKYKEGDSLLIYTDGISESMNENGSQFSNERIKEFFKDNVEANPQEFVSSLFNKSEDFSFNGFQFDDRTIIGVTF